jgi:16S rRNA (uracil1498-N3)-methyltransferase
MELALAQSEGAWLPQLFPEANLERALLAAPAGDRVVLDPGGAPFTSVTLASTPPSIVIALGPEGGIEEDEYEAVLRAGFAPVSLGSSILRFETAGVVAMGIARTLLSNQ